MDTISLILGGVVLLTQCKTSINTRFVSAIAAAIGDMQRLKRLSLQLRAVSGKLLDVARRWSDMEMA